MAAVQGHLIRRSPILRQGADAKTIEATLRESSMVMNHRIFQFRKELKNTLLKDNLRKVIIKSDDKNCTDQCL